MIKKLYLFYRLCRLDAPTGYLLSFFPAAYGMLIANNNKSNYFLLIIFFIGSVITRAAGCIINDIADKDFDNKVFRTQNRPLANKSLNIKEAIVALFILLCFSLLILLSLSKTAIYIGFFASILICIYPLMKRITDFPQVFLGITFNIGTLIGYATIKDQITMQAIIMYIATMFWVIGYDTIYGFMDIKDDKKVGIKSMAIFLENKNYKLFLLSFYSIFITLFIVSDVAYNPLTKNTLYHNIFLIFAYLILCLQIYNLNVKSPQNCLWNFKLNNYVGIILLLYLSR